LRALALALLLFPNPAHGLPPRFSPVVPPSSAGASAATKRKKKRPENLVAHNLSKHPSRSRAAGVSFSSRALPPCPQRPRRLIFFVRS